MLSGKVEEVGELTEKEIIRAERNAGFISDRIREIQVSKQVSSINDSTNSLYIYTR